MQQVLVDGPASCSYICTGQMNDASHEGPVRGASSAWQQLGSTPDMRCACSRAGTL